MLITYPSQYIRAIHIDYFVRATFNEGVETNF